METPKVTKLFRYEVRHYADNSTNIMQEMYSVIAETPKNWRIEEFAGHTRLVLKEGKNVFARPTIKAALKDLIERRNRANQIMRNRIESNKEAIRKAHAELDRVTLESAAVAKGVILDVRNEFNKDMPIDGEGMVAEAFNRRARMDDTLEKLTWADPQPPTEFQGFMPKTIDEAGNIIEPQQS